MGTENWIYYNHADIPTKAPHEIPDMSPITDGSIWKIPGGTTLGHIQSSVLALL